MPTRRNGSSRCAASPIDAMMDGVRQDLDALGISMDRFSSERALVDSGSVAAAIERLTNEGHVYRGILERVKGKEPEDWGAARAVVVPGIRIW